MMKEWTVLDDRVIFGKMEIMLSDVQSVQMFSTPTLLTNGVILLTSNNKPFSMAYPNKLKSEGREAFAYIRDNIGSVKLKINMKSMTDIDNEIKALPVKDDWGTKKEIAELPDILKGDEQIKAITSGISDGNTWLVVCTNRRVLMLDKGLLYGLKLVDIPLDRVNSISHSKGMILGKIAITDGATTRTIENVPNTTVGFFADTVNEQVELYKKSKNAPVAQVVQASSSADELLKFKQLLDMEAITQEEFNAKKKELLGL